MEIIKRSPVEFSESALKDIDNLVDYISEKGYPDTAIQYANRIFDFCSLLSDFPLKYKPCKKKGFQRFGYRCTTFEGTYVIAYKLEKKNIVVIKRIIHGKRLA